MLSRRLEYTSEVLCQRWTKAMIQKNTMIIIKLWTLMERVRVTKKMTVIQLFLCLILILFLIYFISVISQLLAHVGLKPEQEEFLQNNRVLEDLTIEGVVNLIKEGKAKNIIVMTGAGISVASGIPDFRTPGTGLYDNLQKYNLPEPTAIFEMGYFRNNPKPFYTLAKELYPGNYDPTPVHYFVKLLEDKGLLLRNFTQNIDTLERVAGVKGESLVEAHGSFGSARCIDCKTLVDNAWLKETVFKDEIPKCAHCNGYVKPDIVFFGESLPERFHELRHDDFPQCDLLLVIGTSLQVQPFANLIHEVAETVPRFLINREEVGKVDKTLAHLGIVSRRGFRYGEKNNYRDVYVGGDCQKSIIEFARLLGWKDELEKLAGKPL
eukprot:TRINITY_DN144_c1_g1_i2.p1 TRINITY_DN144_c1_g1~~TRINITY_DN144_c1_g1_i2.p1  ORF type:complete len:380 (-),score=94.24 TRINITY_DN144_c1_g1_i2:23-1162(-)